MVKRLLAIFALMTALGACASAEVGKPFTADARSRLKTHAFTTRREAQNALGVPVSVRPAGQGDETWLYEYTKLSAFAHPLPFAEGSIVWQTPHEVLTLRFRFGILVDCAYFYEAYRRSGPVLVAAETRREPCAR